jgi:hypothetical protein
MFVADSNEIAVSYCTGWVEVRYMESSRHRPHLLVWEPKIGKNMRFLVFCEFLWNEKSEVKFFRLKISALKRGIQRCIIFIVILCLIRELRPFKWFFRVQIWKKVRGFFEKFFCRRFERNCGELLYRMSWSQAYGKFAP